VSEFVGARGGSSWVLDPSRIIISLYRAGALARHTEQDHWLIIPSRCFSSLCRAGEDLGQLVAQSRTLTLKEIKFPFVAIF
ncbi:hypothetical protein A2U01_0049312, partial [Trifolium medium]|nr:hypothetical protein [Trifolium medium]